MNAPRSSNARGAPLLVSAVPASDHADVYIYELSGEELKDEELAPEDEVEDYEWFHGVRPVGD